MTTSQAASPGTPLQGLQVLDFSIMMAGPYATRFLSDLGAEVIKVEAPEGDYMRARAPLRDGSSAYFGHLNAGKQSVVLDLKDPAAVAAVRQMVTACDVLVESFRPGAMQRLGLDYETLSALNPRLIYCSMSGFGQTGPAAQRPAYAQIVQALSGYELAHAGYQDAADGSQGASRPANSAIFVADVLGGSFLLSGILAALAHRHLTGRGQQVDTSLLESMLMLMPYEIQEAQFPAPERRPVYPPLKARDGWLMLAAVSPRNFEALLDELGFEGWRQDPTLCTDAARQKNWASVMSRVEAWTSQRSAADAESQIAAAGVPVTVYQTVRQTLQMPQLEHRQSLAWVEDAAGRYRVPNLPFKLSAARVGAREHVPALGEHTASVLRELAGLDDAAVKALLPR